MTPVTDRSFGLLIAYVLPGFAAVALWGPLVPGGEELLYGAEEGPSVGGFLYATLAAVWVGVVLSTLRWALLDPLHHATGLRQPTIEIARSVAAVDAYRVAVELHYRYYQFYGSTLLVAVLAAAFPPGGTHGVALAGAPGKALLALLGTLFLTASRDALRKYYARCQSLAADSRDPCNDQGELAMTNGGDHSHHIDPPNPPVGETPEAIGQTTRDEREPVTESTKQPAATASESSKSS